jgi:hypothetical protein
MALAADDVVGKLSEVRHSAQVAQRAAQRLTDRGQLLVLLLILGVALFVAARIVEDPVRRRLAAAPHDDEPVDSEEEAAVTAGRAEASIPWEEAKRGLAESDQQFA